jgi:hypothetical protein
MYLMLDRLRVLRLAKRRALRWTVSPRKELLQFADRFRGHRICHGHAQPGRPVGFPPPKTQAVGDERPWKVQTRLGVLLDAEHVCAGVRS